MQTLVPSVQALPLFPDTAELGCEWAPASAGPACMCSSLALQTSECAAFTSSCCSHATNLIYTIYSKGAGWPVGLGFPVFIALNSISEQPEKSLLILLASPLRLKKGQLAGDTLNLPFESVKRGSTCAAACLHLCPPAAPAPPGSLPPPATRPPSSTSPPSLLSALHAPAAVAFFFPPAACPLRCAAPSPFSLYAV